MTDARQPWELEYCLRLNFCSHYLDMMATTGRERQFLMSAYGTNGELDRWCVAHIQAIVEKCDAIVDENGPLSAAALTVTRPCSERVMELDTRKELTR